MPKPTNKQELLDAITERNQQLNELIDSFDEDQLTSEFAFESLNRSIRDVVAHLWEWQLMFLGWYEVGMSGHKPDMPAKGYSWQKLPELNTAIQEKHKGISLQEAMENLAISHEKILEIVRSHSEEELFQKKRYAWTGSTSLAAYITSAAWSHFNWASKLMKKHKKTLN